jgi:hypothetical protein
MKLLKFYYFNFLYYYRNKPASWDSWFRSLMLVELTIFFLTFIILLLTDNRFLDHIPHARLYNIILNIIILVARYRGLARNGKSQIIFDDLISHHWNTKTNRIICWTIWILSVTLFISISIIKNR